LCGFTLARRGQGAFLVLESRERIGGACTIEEPFPNVRMSPWCVSGGPAAFRWLLKNWVSLRLGYSWSPA